MCGHHKGLPMLNMVHNNFKMYTKNKIQKAILARKVQATVPHPTNVTFDIMVSSPTLIFPL